MHSLVYANWASGGAGRTLRRVERLRLRNSRVPALPVFDAAFFILAVTVFVAGVARGLSGFGTGMIVAPVAAALYGPKVALVALVIMDSLPTIPVTIPVLKIARWREVLPVAAGIAALLPLGVYILKVGDEVMLRWTISAAILLCAALLWSGWRYLGRRTMPLSFAVGGIAGVLSGIASIPGPPIIFYWMAAELPAVIMRANLLTVFVLGESLSLVNLWAAGLLVGPAVMLGITQAIPYFVGLMIGWKLHTRASDEFYRRMTFILIVLAAVLALPAIEPLFRWLGQAAG